MLQRERVNGLVSETDVRESSVLKEMQGSEFTAFSLVLPK
jgi:hypothetical protein